MLPTPSTPRLPQNAVSLLKLAKVADVHFGMGFWAFAALILCMAAAIASIDRDELWDRLEVAKG